MRKRITTVPSRHLTQLLSEALLTDQPNWGCGSAALSSKSIRSHGRTAQQVLIVGGALSSP